MHRQIRGDLLAVNGKLRAVYGLSVLRIDAFLFRLGLALVPAVKYVYPVFGIRLSYASALAYAQQLTVGRSLQKRLAAQRGSIYLMDRDVFYHFNMSSFIYTR